MNDTRIVNTSEVLSIKDFFDRYEARQNRLPSQHQNVTECKNLMRCVISLCNMSYALLANIIKAVMFQVYVMFEAV